MDSTLFSDIAQYLDAVRALYPGGVPKECISSPALEVADVSGADTAVQVFGSDMPQVTFVGSFEVGENLTDGTEGALLLAAIEKGMKLNLESVRVLVSVLPAEVLVHAPLCVVLGERSARNVGFVEVPPPGTWLQRGEVDFMVTHTLEAVLRSPEIKKEFWHHLQQVLEKL